MKDDEINKKRKEHIVDNCKLIIDKAAESPDGSDIRIAAGIAQDAINAVESGNMELAALHYGMASYQLGKEYSIDDMKKLIWIMLQLSHGKEQITDVNLNNELQKIINPETYPEHYKAVQSITSRAKMAPEIFKIALSYEKIADQAECERNQFKRGYESNLKRENNAREARQKLNESQQREIADVMYSAHEKCSYEASKTKMTFAYAAAGNWLEKHGIEMIDNRTLKKYFDRYYKDL